MAEYGRGMVSALVLLTMQNRNFISSTPCDKGNYEISSDGTLLAHPSMNQPLSMLFVKSLEA